MARKQTASARVKAAKRQAPVLVRRLTTALRRGACREAGDALSDLSVLQLAIDRIAWSGRAPRVISEASMRRVKNAYRSRCRL